MDLAMALGAGSVTAMLRDMPSAELALWEVRYGKEFLGPERGDWRAGMVAATVANYAGRILPDGVTRSSTEFMAFTEANESPPAPEDVGDKIDRAMRLLQMSYEREQQEKAGGVPSRS